MLINNRKHVYMSAWDLIFSLIMAFMFTVAPHYIADGSFAFSGSIISHTLIYCAAFLVGFVVLRYLLAKLDFEIGFFRKILDHKHSLLILALLMFLIWLPVLIILYPGTVINDTWGQLSQFVYTFYSGDKIHFDYLGDHHPVLTTFVMGQLIVPLANATGNLQIAFFVYVILQSMVTCLGFAYSLTYMDQKLKVGSGFIFIAFLIYSLLPIFPGSAQMIGKDSLNAWIFVFFTISFMEIVRTRGESLDSAYNRDLFILLAWAFCVTKKVSFYVVLLSMLLLLFVVKKNRIKIGVILLCGVILMQVAWPRIMNATGFVPGGKTEMLSLPYQMTARYVKEHPDDISEDEYVVIDRMLRMDSLADRYDPVSADPVKGFAFYERFETSAYVDYIKVWAAQGLRHPVTYLNAILAMESGWFSWTKYYPLMDMNWHSQLNKSFFSEESTVRPERIGKIAKAYQGLLDKLYETPVVGFFFTYGLYSALIPAFVITTLLTRRKKNEIHAWIVSMPIFFSLALGCWLAPVSIHFEGRRYLYPIIFTALILTAWCRYWLKLEDTNDANEAVPEEMNLNGSNSSTHSVL